MRQPRIGIALEGIPAIFLTAFSAIIFVFLKCSTLAFIFLILCWFSVYFFRDPERVIPKDEGVAVSPADGKVIKIESRADPFTGEICCCISIFMNVFSVHVNRSPIDCCVKDICYYPGKFFNASFDKASKDNERCAYHLCDKDGKAWSMVQIAGLIARRIVVRAEIGDNLARGERYGLIRFGSRVDLYLPQGYAPTVYLGEQIFAGQSIVAKAR